MPNWTGKMVFNSAGLLVKSFVQNNQSKNYLQALQLLLLPSSTHGNLKGEPIAATLQSKPNQYCYIAYPHVIHLHIANLIMPPHVCQICSPLEKHFILVLPVFSNPFPISATNSSSTTHPEKLQKGYAQG